MQKSLAKNSIFNLIYVAANILFPFITSIYVSRILLPTGVGKVASAQNIVSYFVSIAALGLPSYGVREFAKIRDDKNKCNKLFTELLLINLISTTLAAIGFIFLLIFNSGFNGEWYLYIACGLLIIFNYINIDWMYQGLEEYGYIVGRSLAIKTLSVIALFIFVKSKQDYVIYALISSLATGGNYIFNIIHSRKFVSLDFKNIELTRHLKPVLLIACIIFLSSIYNKIDVTMLGIMANDESIGYYTYAQKTINIVLSMSNAITAALLPRLSYYYENDKEGFYNLLNKGFQVISFTAIPFCVGLFIVSPLAVEFLYGGTFAPTSLTIRLLCPLIIVKSFGDLFCYQLAYSTKNEKIIIPASAMASAINIITNALLIPTLLQNGAVIASVASEVITNCVQFLYLKKKVGYHLEKKSLFTSLFCTLIMGAAVYLLTKISLGNTLRLFISVISGIIIYMILNLILGNKLMLEAINKVKDKLSRN